MSLTLPRAKGVGGGEGAAGGHSARGWQIGLQPRALPLGLCHASLEPSILGSWACGLASNNSALIFPALQPVRL